MIAGVIPAGYELLDHGAHGSYADNTHGNLAINSLQTANQAQAAGETVDSGWRYTKDGWQNRIFWESPPPVRKPALHPTVVGAFQLLLCLAVLVGFSANGRRVQTDK
jgi:hypothetical protein